MFTHKSITLALLLVALLMSACGGPAAAPTTAPTLAPTTAPTFAPTATSAPTAMPATVTPAALTFDDPFAYCAAVGTIDAPDARYVGAKMPEAVAKGLQKALGGNVELAPLMQNSFWRCMDGKVYACTVGANLECESKADTNRTPTREMNDFCAANPNSDFIPMAVTGHATVFQWACANGAPQIAKQLIQPDARGFLSNIWYQVSPG